MQEIPLAEVKLDSRDIALRIRKLFAEKKAGEDFGKIYIPNSVTLRNTCQNQHNESFGKKILY